MTKIELPPIVKKFIDEKIICMEIPLLPCLYQNFEKMQEGYRYDPIKQCLLITDKPGSWGNGWYFSYSEWSMLWKISWSYYRGSIYGFMVSG